MKLITHSISQRKLHPTCCLIFYTPRKVLDTKLEEVHFDTPPTNRAGLSDRGPEPCPWSSCPCEGARAARFSSGALGIPEGRARTVGDRVTAFLTKVAMSREYLRYQYTTTAMDCGVGFLLFPILAAVFSRRSKWMLYIMLTGNPRKSIKLHGVLRKMLRMVFISYIQLFCFV